MKATQEQYDKAVEIYETSGQAGVLLFAEREGITAKANCLECESFNPICEDDTCLVCGSLIERCADTCTCDSGKQGERQYDGHGIYLCTTCPDCEEEKLSRFRPDIFERYDCDEPIDCD